MIATRKERWLIGSGVVLWFAYWTTAVVATLFTNGCAHVKPVVRTVNDVASLACQIFGTEHPDEFRYIVEQKAPPDVRGFGVKELCALHEVLNPFIQDQLRLQQETQAGVRAQMASPNAADPQP